VRTREAGGVGFLRRSRSAERGRQTLTRQTDAFRNRIPSASFIIYKGVIERLYTEPPAGSVVTCLDELGPESAKTFAGQRLVDATKRPAERARQEIDYGRRGKGYIFGASQPATGEAFTQDYPRRTIANWVDFLEQVEQHLAPEIERVYAILDNLNTHHADDVLLFCARHPRLRVRLPAHLRRLSQSHRTKTNLKQEHCPALTAY
jgi:hypothetical protein